MKNNNPAVTETNPVHARAARSSRFPCIVCREDVVEGRQVLVEHVDSGGMVFAWAWIHPGCEEGLEPGFRRKA